MSLISSSSMVTVFSIMLPTGNANWFLVFGFRASETQDDGHRNLVKSSPHRHFSLFDLFRSKLTNALSYRFLIAGVTLGETIQA